MPKSHADCTDKDGILCIDGGVGTIDIGKVACRSEGSFLVFYNMQDTKVIEVLSDGTAESLGGFDGSKPFFFA